MIPSVLSSQLITGVKEFLTTTFPSSTPAFFEMMKQFVDEKDKLYKGPYLSVALPFKQGQENKNYFPKILDDGFKPYYHQELAFKRLGREKPKPTLVATGTGSGKTEAFMFPILEYCRNKRETKGIKAIIIYPMNALATDQAKRFAKTIAQTASLEGIRVGLYIGSQEENAHAQMSEEYVITDKEKLLENPPDVLLTNYKMLDFMLMRPKDQAIWKHNLNSDVLKFMAVDEIHSFDGAGGTDLASLIRRVRAKLGVQKGTLACIGTSATLGGDGTADIRAFASDIFAEEFNEDSVIEEYRIDADEFFVDASDDILFFPQPSSLGELDFRAYESIESYITAQYLLWFNEEVEDVGDAEFRVKLGEKLKSLHFFKLLLKTVDGKIVDRKVVIDAFIRKIPIKSSDTYFEFMVDSLLALTSWARNPKQGSSYPPFLFVRLQIWLRELARMVSSLDEKPNLTFSDDLKADELTRHYPVIHCRDCHATGWGGVKKEGTAELKDDLDLFYQAFFARDSRVKFIFPMEHDEKQGLKGKIYYIDQQGNEVFDKDDAFSGLKVFEPDNIDKQGKSHANCPFCNAKNALTILGSRAASLTSVLVGQNFTSHYNDDKKIIAFSDSVQDSAQRAGFFGARSYQFTIRSAIQQALNAQDSDVRLEELGERVSTYWRDKLNDDSEYVATLIAPDMEWLREYDTLVKTDRLENREDIVSLVNRRIDWMIHSEYGYKSNIGRTLDRSGASVMYLDGLDEVIDELLPLVQNEIEQLREIDQEQLEKFMFGLMLYLKNSGAIYSDHIESFISSGGEAWLINQRSLYMPKFSPNARNPQMISNGKFKAFDRVTNSTKTTWYDRWIAHNFVDNALLVPDTLQLYRLIFGVLIKAKLLLEKEVKDSSVWMINPQKLYISNDVGVVRCSKCKHRLSLVSKQKQSAIGGCCLRKECVGHYEEYVIKEDYYKLLYSHGDLQRVVAREHTGLLKREDREKVENEFIGRKEHESWKTNLLSATPTLEMGIDIGDLSSVMLCSVPPNGANYLQRIGRAGRNDGNAFNATLANATPHDLYFYSDPNEIMQGAIEAPGVYIDASAILQRQFLAFCIDSWVTKKNIRHNELPTRLKFVLSSIKNKKKDKFPYILFDFIENDKETLLNDFFGLYEEKLQENSKEKLRNFVEGNDDSHNLIGRILNRLELIIQEEQSLSRQISTLRKKIKSYIEKEAKELNHEEILREMRSEYDGLRSVRRLITGKMTFEFFADEGLLPNYAFPESGVLLKSVIYRKRDTRADENGKRYDTYTYEYERAGSSAISELAPNNSFYAGGRKVKIDQIDMGVSEVEEWIFCDKCSYMQRQGGENLSHCPKCASEMFGDEGQKKEILRMRQVMATSDDKSSRLKDDKDQRDILFFNKQLLINFDKKDIEDAYAIVSNETSFGFEFIEKVNFREINFGEVTLIGNDISIAGMSVPRKGFVICKECGKVQFGKPSDEKFKPDHAFSCNIEDTFDEKSYFESLYLYREFDSEAIRLMLPISSLDIDEEKLHSLIASFHLGLKSYFRGSVEHLKVGIYDEIDNPNEYAKRYLILYDTVPGGTGYLKQLMRDEKPLFEVLEVALTKLGACPCSDGCYRCIYAYKNNFDRPLISKRKATEIIERILASKESIRKINSVSEVNSDTLSESVLEELFISKLKVLSSSWKKHITQRGRDGYLFEMLDEENNKHSYELEQQVELKQSDGVLVYSKADFVLYPLKTTDLKPIVVFTDGFAYHESRVALDTAQRMAIVKSSKFIVWSLTWEDIDNFGKRGVTYNYENYLHQANLEFFKKLYTPSSKFIEKSSFEWLIELLTSKDELLWQQRAMTLSASFIKPKPFDTTQKSFTQTGADDLLKLNEQYLGSSYGDDEVSLSILATKETLGKGQFGSNIIILHLKDRLGKLEFSSWSGFLRAYNLFQFLEQTLFTTSLGVEEHAYEEITFSQESSLNQEWEAIFEEVVDEAQALVKKLSTNKKISLPLVGEEIVDDKGVVIGESELMWSKLKIIVTLEEKPLLEGWSIFTIDEEESIIKTLQEKGA